MTIVDGPSRAGLIARVQGILLRPSSEWDVIEGEAATPQGLFVGYACILAAIPAIAGFIGLQIFGIGFLGVSYHPPLIGSLVNAIVSYALSLVMIFVLALIIDALAPSFDGEKSQIQALKVAVYSYTAAWVGGIFSLIPMLSAIGLLISLYGFYLLYKGLPRLMRAPDAKALGYTIVTIVAAIVLSIVVGAVVYAVRGAVGFGAAGLGGFSSAQSGALSGSVKVNGANVDLGKLQAASQQMAAAANAAGPNGKAPPAIASDKLKALLPDSVAGLPRIEISSENLGAAGTGASGAEAVYGKDNERITLSVTDLAMASGLAALAGALNVNSDKETATGYEKTSTINGRLTVERWDRASKTGEYSLIVAGRFAVKAEGSAGGIDDLKSAVAAVGPDRLASLAKA